MTTYNDAADKGWDRFISLWNDAKVFDGATNGFWLCGNTTRVIVEYLLARKKSDGPKLETCVKFFENTVPFDATEEQLKTLTSEGLNAKPKGGAWLDDYGWWGIALLDALAAGDQIGTFPNKDARLTAGAKHCWTIMSGGWNTTNNVPIGGGIWNNDQGLDMSGRNNITNELFWLISLRLYDLTKDKSYLTIPGFANESMDAWYQKAIGADLLYVDVVSMNGMTYKQVRERLKGMSNGSPDYYWVADQAWFADCCFRQGRGKIGAQVYSDTIGAMTDSNNVLHDRPFPLSGYELDYATGKGVFIAKLAENQEPYAIICLTASADAVWNNRLQPDNQFLFNWNPKGKFPGGEPENDLLDTNLGKMVLQASGLAALYAQATVHGTESIPASASIKMGAAT
jgi:hypothetical protein